MKLHMSKARRVVYDGEPNPGKGTDTGAGTPPPPAEKTFTQGEINNILKVEREKHEGKVRSAISELEALKAKATLTTKEREELETRIQTMSNELLTKEELAKRQFDDISKKHKIELEKLNKELSDSKNRYESETIHRNIVDAAVTNSAFEPEQIVALLRPNTRLVEELDGEGKPTGKFSPKVKFMDTDKDGKEVTLDLTIPESIKRMKEMERHFNLFKGEGSGGIGSYSKGSGKQMDITELAKNPEAYRKARKEGKLTFEEK